MIQNRRPQFSFISITSRRICHNGIGIGINTSYMNINGVERGFASIQPIIPFGKNLLNCLDDEISNYKRDTENNFKNLENMHKKSMQRTQSQFFDIKKYLEKELNNDKNDELIRKKEKELKDLEEYENNLDLDRANLNDTYMFTERRKNNKKITEKRKKIDEKYKFTKPKLEFTEKEKNRMQDYKNEIKRLNTYSNNPHFNSVINDFELNDYI